MGTIVHCVWIDAKKALISSVGSEYIWVVHGRFALAPNRIFENDDPIFDPNFDPNCPGVLLDASSLAASLMADARVACIKFMFIHPTEVPGMWAQLFVCVWMDVQ